MFNCRPLDSEHRVLRTDYSVDCNDEKHLFYQIGAGVMMVAFAFGIPVGMGILMVRRMRDYSSTGGTDRFMARRVADELKITDVEAADAIRDVTTGREYSFLVNAYKPRYYHWEGVDMVRKLLLVGVLAVAGRGSVSQLFVAAIVSCVSLVLQVYLSPYKHREDNVFKTVVEIHILLVVLIAPVLKSLQSDDAEAEVVPVAVYDALLVISFIASIIVGFVWTVCAKRSMMKAALRERAVTGTDSNDESSAKATQRAIRLLRLGLTTNDDIRLLTVYFQTLENMVSKWSHVFISYRVASDRELARRLHDSLSALTIEETGQKLRVYLDATRLEDGQRWDTGFMKGLSKSWVFVPIVSVGCVQPMMALSEAEDWCDNVLLEWTAALELHQRGTIKAVLPLLAGQGSFFSDAQAAFGGVSALPGTVSASTMEQVAMHLHEHTDDGSIEGLRELVQQATGEPEPTIKSIVNALLKFQGIKVSASGAGTAHSHGHLSVGLDDLTECVGRVHSTVSACLKRVGMDQNVVATDDGGLSPSPRASSSPSLLGRLSSRLSTRSGSGGGSMRSGTMGGGGGERGMLEVSFGERDGGGSGGSGLYLSSD